MSTPTNKLLFFNKEGYPYNLTYDEENNEWYGKIYFDDNGSDTFKTVCMYIFEKVSGYNFTDTFDVRSSQLFNYSGITFVPSTSTGETITDIQKVNSSENYYSKWIYGYNFDKKFPIGSVVSFSGVTGSTLIDLSDTGIIYNVLGNQKGAFLIDTNENNGSGFTFIFSGGTVSSLNIIKSPDYGNQLIDLNYLNYYKDKKLSISGSANNDGVYTYNDYDKLKIKIYDFNLSIQTGGTIYLGFYLMTQRPELYEGNILITYNSIDINDQTGTTIKFYNYINTNIDFTTTGQTIIFENIDGSHIHADDPIFTITGFVNRNEIITDQLNFFTNESVNIIQSLSGITGITYNDQIELTLISGGEYSYHDKRQFQVLSVTNNNIQVREYIIPESGSTYRIDKIIKKNKVQDLYCKRTAVDTIGTFSGYTVCYSTSNYISMTQDVLNSGSTTYYYENTIAAMKNKYKTLLDRYGLNLYHYHYMGNDYLIFEGLDYNYRPYYSGATAYINSTPLNIDNNFSGSTYIDSDIYYFNVDENFNNYEKFNIYDQLARNFYVEIYFDIAIDSTSYGFNINLNNSDYYIDLSGNTTYTQETINSFINKYSNALDGNGITVYSGYTYSGYTGYTLIIESQQPNINLYNVEVKVNSYSNYSFIQKILNQNVVVASDELCLYTVDERYYPDNCESTSVIPEINCVDGCAYTYYTNGSYGANSGVLCITGGTSESRLQLHLTINKGATIRICGYADILGLAGYSASNFGTLIVCKNSNVTIPIKNINVNIENYGIVDMTLPSPSDEINLNVDRTLHNYNTFNVSNPLVIKGILTNKGTFTTIGTVSTENDGQIVNNCSFFINNSSSDALNIVNGSVSSHGLVNDSNGYFYIIGCFNISSTGYVSLSSKSLIECYSFDIDGQVYGPITKGAQIRASHTSEINENANLSGYINLWSDIDISPSGGSYDPYITFVSNVSRGNTLYGYELSTGMIINVSGFSHTINNKQFNILRVTEDTIQLSYQGAFLDEENVELNININEFIRYPRGTYDRDIYYKFSWQPIEDNSPQITDDIFFYDYSGDQLQYNDGLTYLGEKPLWNSYTENLVFLNKEPNNNINRIYDPEYQQTVFSNITHTLEKLNSSTNYNYVAYPMQIFIGFNSKNEGVSNNNMIIEKIENIIFSGTTNSNNNFLITGSTYYSDIYYITSDYYFDFNLLGFEVNQKISLNFLENTITGHTLFGNYDTYTIVDVTKNKITVNEILEFFDSSLSGKTYDFTIKTEPITIAIIQLYGQTEVEDERFNQNLKLIGSKLESDVQQIFKESDINEVGIDYIILNRKRKELLSVYNDIYNYISSYKALINSINYFGYNDLELYEYYKCIKPNSPLFGKLQRIHIEDIFINTIPGWNEIEMDDVNYLKTNLFNLTYNITDFDGNYILMYSLEEVQKKLNKLIHWLRNNVVPLSANILDVTGVAQTIGTMYLNYNGSNYIKKIIVNQDCAAINFDYIETLNIDTNYLFTINFYLTSGATMPKYWTCKIKTFHLNETTLELEPVQYHQLYKFDLLSYSFNVDKNIDPYMYIETQSYNDYGLGYTNTRFFNYNEGRNFILVNNNFTGINYKYLADDYGFYIITDGRYYIIKY